MQQPYIFIPGLKAKVLKVETFEGSPVKYKQQAEGVFIYTDGVNADAYDTVLKLEVK